MDIIGLFDLLKVNAGGSLILMPWAQEAYGVRTSDELIDYLEATEKIAEAEFDKLMAELEGDDLE